MDFRHLHHAVVLGRLLNYTKAARKLGLTQSALSRSIQAFERESNVRLFDRGKGGVHLTSVGRAALDRAEGVLRDVKDLERMLARAASGEEGEIAFGMTPFAAATLLSTTLSASMARNPDLRYQIAVRNSDALLPLLIAEEIEFFVCAEGQFPKTAPVRSEMLGWVPTSLLVRADHPLLRQGTDARLDDFPLLVTARFDQYRNTLENGPEFLKRPPQAVLEDQSALSRITQASDAIWLFSSFAAADQILAGLLKEIPFPPPLGQIPFRTMICHLDQRPLSPAALRIRDLFRSRLRWLTGQLGDPKEALAPAVRDTF